MLKLSSIIFASVLTANLALPNASRADQVLNVLLDVGPGGTIFQNEAYSKHATNQLTSIVEELELAENDYVNIVTFGSSSAMDHITLPELNHQFQFTYRGAQVSDIGVFLANQITAISEVSPHRTSDLTAGLERLTGLSRCSSHDVTTVVLSNFREIGEVVENRFDLWYTPLSQPMCGRLVLLGFWVNDPAPVMGLKQGAQQVVGEFSTAHNFGVVDYVQ